MCWCLKKQDNPTYSIERVAFRFHRLLPEFVWDASMLEGNPFTFPEVQTLLDGVTVGGQKISDQEQVLESQIEHPFEKAAAFFLFGALQQFFFDGNKRTSRFMMNGIPDRLPPRGETNPQNKSNLELIWINKWLCL